MLKQKPKLSVALATFNEESNIGRCLEAVKDIADEIMIVDGTSTDKTVAIAKNYKTKVTVTDNPPNFHINKKKAIEQCRGDWVLLLDADEVVSPELAAEIKLVVNSSQDEINNRQLSADKQRLFSRHQQLVEQRDGPIGKASEDIVAFFFPRRNYFLGKFLRYAGTYPDGVIRLFKRGKAHQPARDVHEQIEVNGQVGWMAHDLLHYDSPTFDRYLVRNARYAALFAKQLQADQVRFTVGNTIHYLLIKPAVIFLNLFLRHKGYKDGLPGLVFSFYSGLTWFAAYVKYWEMEFAKHD
jgi:glycosyltransferase involved in cell wall biosynthesis